MPQSIVARLEVLYVEFVLLYKVIYSVFVGR
jgi:hypothetical protein